MKAAYIKQYGADLPLIVGEMDQPEPKRNEVLIRVAASSVNPIDWKIFAGQARGIISVSFPQILGYDFSGVVVETGEDVEGILPGYEVYGCLPRQSMGSYAEFVAAPSNVVAVKPKSLSYEQAAAIPLAGITAYQALTKYRPIKTGDRVLIIGGSGGVGSFAVQIAKSFGAIVTAVCSSRNIDLVKGLGADTVIDYTKESFQNVVTSQDMVFDTIGHETLSSCFQVIKKDGIFISAVPSPKIIWDWIKQRLIFSKQKSYLIILEPNQQVLDHLSHLVAEGKLHPVIDSTYSLKDVNDAHLKSKTHHAQGKIVLVHSSEA